MQTGLTIPGKVIYWIYSFLCHQLPERSYFLFGPKISYSIGEIQSVWKNTKHCSPPAVYGKSANGLEGCLVRPNGVDVYQSLDFRNVVGVVPEEDRRLPWWGLVLLLLPMAIDGTTHFLSDLAGFGQGFSGYQCLVGSVDKSFIPPFFYAGDAWGSFNAWMRLITGILFGLGIVWFGFPYVNEFFIDAAEGLEYKYQYRAWYLMEKERLLKMAPLGGLNKIFLRFKSSRDQTKT